jgi:vacuolar-type H+-ATPase subunit E/Vma4
MALAGQDSPDALCAEILAEAKRHSDDILRRAKSDAESILSAATAEAEKIRRERREQAQAEAARRKGSLLSAAAVETGRLRAARVEQLLQSVREEIRRRLFDPFPDNRQTIVALTVEAIRRMAGNDFILKLSASALATDGNGLTEEISRLAGRSPLNLTTIADATTSDGGVIVESADGFQVWDNRLLSRLERLWPELRQQIAVRAALVRENEASGGVA